MVAAVTNTLTLHKIRRLKVAKKVRPRKPKYSLEDLVDALTVDSLDFYEKPQQNSLLKDMLLYLDEDPDSFWVQLHQALEMSSDFDQVKEWESAIRGGQRRPSYSSLPKEVFAKIVAHNSEWISQPAMQDQIKGYQSLIIVLGQSAEAAELRKLLRQIDPALVTSPGAGNTAIHQPFTIDIYERSYTLFAVLNEAVKGSGNLDIRLRRILGIENKDLANLLLDQIRWQPGSSPHKAAIDYLSTIAAIPPKTLSDMISRERAKKYPTYKRGCIPAQLAKYREELRNEWIACFNIEVSLSKNRPT
jgi:hypothetical protein